MGIRTILENLRDGIAGSTVLKAYCQTKYAKDHTVYLGLNKQNPPGEENAPLVIISLVDSAEVAGNRKRWKLLLGYCVFDETLTITGNKNTYEGFLLAEELREKTEEVILSLRKILGKIEFDGGTLENEIYPFFTASSYVIIETINTSRS